MDGDVVLYFWFYLFERDKGGLICMFGGMV